MRTKSLSSSRGGLFAFRCALFAQLTHLVAPGVIYFPQSTHLVFREVFIVSRSGYTLFKS